VNAVHPDFLNFPFINADDRKVKRKIFPRRLVCNNSPRKSRTDTLLEMLAPLILAETAVLENNKAVFVPSFGIQRFLS
jgi:hypothetical protein